MSADGGHLEFSIGRKKIGNGPSKDHLCYVCFELILLISEIFFHYISIGSYVKTMSTDCCHLEFRIGAKTITFVEVYQMIVHVRNKFSWFVHDKKSSEAVSLT